MFRLILFIVSFLVILLSVLIGMIVIYHFRRFGIKDDANVKRFLNAFEIGSGVIIALNLVLLFLIVF